MLRLLPALREYSDVKEFTNAADAGSVSAAGSVVQSVAFAIAKHQCRYFTAQVWAAGCSGLIEQGTLIRDNDFYRLMC